MLSSRQAVKLVLDQTDHGEHAQMVHSYRQALLHKVFATYTGGDFINPYSGL